MQANVPCTFLSCGQESVMAYCPEHRDEWKQDVIENVSAPECVRCSRTASKHLCEFHSECDKCSQEATNLLCANHINSPECSECGDDDPTLCSSCGRNECSECGNTATRCDIHSNNNLCASEPARVRGDGTGCSDDAEYHYCEDHQQAHDQDVIEGYESNRDPDTPECSDCGYTAKYFLCEDHFQERRTVKYTVENRVDESFEEEKEPVTMENKSDEVSFYDIEGNFRKMTREQFRELIEAETGLVPVFWPESAGSMTRSVRIDGYSFPAQQFATTARTELGMVFPQETTKETITSADKLLIADLLQREQYKRFVNLRDAFNTPSSSDGAIPENVQQALNDYNAITSLMERFGVEAIANVVLGQMAEALTQREAQLSN